MILKQLSQHIEMQQLVSEEAIAKKFSISEGSIEAMLSIYIQKGRIVKEIRNNKVFYRWLKAGQIPIQISI